MSDLKLIDMTIIPEGSVVAVRIDDCVKHKRMRELADQLVRAGKARGLSFIVMSPEIQLATVTDQQLALAGLRRIPKA